MTKRKYCLIIFLLLLLFMPGSSFSQSGKSDNPVNDQKKAQLETDNKPATEKKDLPRPVLAITPREIDLGAIGQNDKTAGLFTFRNMGAGILPWTITCPEGWRVPDIAKLSGTIEDGADYLRVEIRSLSQDNQSNGQPPKKAHAIEMTLDAGDRMVCRKNFAAGMHREAIKVASSGGQRTIFLSFKVIAGEESARIDLSPLRLDMGAHLAGKTVSKILKLTNSGTEMLKWNVTTPRQKATDSATRWKKGKYISFLNEEAKGTKNYFVSGYLKDAMELIGKWNEEEGYPVSSGSGNSLKYRFHGTGVSLFFTTYEGEGNLNIYIDDTLVNSHDWLEEQKVRGDMLLAEGLEDAPHTITIVNKEGHIELEGIKVFGRDILQGNPGWIKVVPDSGTTTREIDYLNVTLNTARLAPGYYSDNVFFKSNGGDASVEVFLEILPDSAPKIIDIYRFTKGSDYLLTANPQAETKKLAQNAYVKEGIAFRLFGQDIPGTMNFYRWYNPQIKNHYYHHDMKGGGKSLKGYIFEGSIGNIATSKMTNTKPLYRWLQPATGHHFYTTDQKGELAAKKGYKFDGIAGYVR